MSENTTKSHGMIENFLHSTIDHIAKGSRSEIDERLEEERDRTEFLHVVALLEAEPEFENERTREVGYSPVSKTPIVVTEKATISGLLFHRSNKTATLKYHFPLEAGQTVTVTLRPLTHEVLLHEALFEGDIPEKQDVIKVKLNHHTADLIVS